MRKGHMASRAYALALLALVACAHKPPPPPPPPAPVPTKLTITAAANINPDGQGNPSPVVVRLFQLRTDAQFAGTQYFPLYDAERQTLGADLISRDEFTLMPGQSRLVEWTVTPDARFLGVLAAYRDPGAVWRALVAVPRNSTGNTNIGRIFINLQKTSVTLTVDK